jgi:lysyl-tRNA synthetase class 1
LADSLDNDWIEKDYQKNLFNTARANNVRPPELFSAVYTVLMGQERGPRAAPFILSLEKDFVQKRFRLKG